MSTLSKSKSNIQQELGLALPNWQGAGIPVKEPLPVASDLNNKGLEIKPLTMDHAELLWATMIQEPNNACWTYLPYGPFSRFNNFKDWLSGFMTGNHTAYVILKADQLNNTKALGWYALMNIQAQHGSIEIGHVYYSHLLRQTRDATLALYTLLQYVTSLGYRRIEWKCNNLNVPSKKAALRYGFSFEGIFRNANVIKGHSRDTAWFSMIDTEYTARLQRFKLWLSLDNFDDRGKQKTPIPALKLEN